MKRCTAIVLMGTCCSLVALTSPAAADTATLNPSKDNTLIESATGALSNALGDIFVGRTGQPVGQSVRRGVIAFDVAAGIPGGATITSAKLRLYMNMTIDMSSRTHN